MTWVELKADNIRLTRRVATAEALNVEAAGLFRLLADAYPTVTAPRHWLEMYEAG